MTITQEQVCNLALLKLGSDSIVNITDPNRPAEMCNTLFPLIRDEMLRQHPWNFAIQRALLIANPNDTPDFEFNFFYPLPDDYLRLVMVYKSNMRFRIEGTNILSDDDEVDIIYIASMTDPTTWDPLFREAFATRLAAEVAFGLTGSATLQQQLMADYDKKLQKAKTVDSQENYNDGFVVHTLTDARMTPGTTDWANLGFPF